MVEKNSKGKRRKWEPVELDDPSFFEGEMDGFVSLEVMADYHPEELAGISAGGPAQKKKIKERPLQEVNCLKSFKTYRMVKFRRYKCKIHFKHVVKLPLYFTRNWEKLSS